MKLSSRAPLRQPIADIYLNHLADNFREIQTMASDSRILAVIKADAYGHGAVPVAQTLAAAGVYGFGIALHSELIELLDAGIKQPILHLGRVSADVLEIARHGQIRCSLNSMADVDFVREHVPQDETVKFHLKLDTGMGRLGALPADMGALLDAVSHSTQIELEGFWTHLAAAEDPESDSFTAQQLQIYRNFIPQVRQTCPEVQFFHAANSAAMLRQPAAHFNMVRPGVVLFGVSPLLEPIPSLKPVMAFRAPVRFVKEIPAGTSVGYGRAFKAQELMKIGIIQAGYADGVPPEFRNNGQVEISGNLLPIIGRISMDMTAIDCRHFPHVERQIITFWGGDHPELRLEHLARKYNQLPYFFLTRVSKRVRRIYRENGIKLTQ